MPRDIYDFCVIGGGIVGLATAYELSRQHAGAQILLVEKEAALGQHQSSHNSGVIHAGVYYKPGSLKARLCREGSAATRQFCDDHAIPYEIRGKLIVATSEDEMARMADLQANAMDNGLTVERIDSQELRQIEPNIVGHGALLVRESGIVDYEHICRVLGDLLRAHGTEIVLNAPIDRIVEEPDGVEIASGDRSWRCRQLVVCAGLQSDRLARLSGIDVEHRIIPFRGEYYRLPPEKRQLVHHLIYPVPDPAMPFLGIHLTPMIDGTITIGPNAVLSLARERYAGFSPNIADLASVLQFPGFWRMLAGNWKSAIDELGSSLFKPVYLRKSRKYCPELTLADLLPFRPGIRAQAMLRDGSLVHDFLFLKSPHILHVGNAPSPAATAAFPIGRLIVEEMRRMREAAG